ncbi:MAG: DHHA1 domain-containing protein [Nitrososphaerales archaeon]
MSNKGFQEALRSICDNIYDIISADKEIAVITHIDADGITSGSIVTKSLIRKNAKCILRTVSDMNSSTITRLKEEGHEFYIICDLGAGFASEIQQAFGEEYLVIDHHQLPENEMKDIRVFNAWKYGIDGGKEVCAGGMAYMVASTLDRRNKDLSCLAVVAALADRQDQGEKKSLIGLNSEIADTAKSLGLISIDLDLMLMGRETRPLYESLAYTSFPYIEGLTWNADSCLSLLNMAGIKLKDNGRWRVLAELGEDEKGKVLETIAKFVSSTSRSSDVIDDIVGHIFTLPREDNRSMLRDAREFSLLLNACGRIRKAGVGVAICLGDRSSMLKQGESIVAEYRSTLRKYLSAIFSEKWRIIDDGNIVLVNGEGLIAEDMLGAVSSLLSGSPSLYGKMLFVKTRADDGSYKFSSRKCLRCESNTNLGLLMRECSAQFNGSGGGHDAAAGARVVGDKVEEFIACIKKNIAED